MERDCLKKIVLKSISIFAQFHGEMNEMNETKRYVDNK